MTVTYYPEIEQGSDEWLQARCGIITASTIGRLITVSAPGPAEYNCPECGSLRGNPCISMSRKDAVPIKTMHGARTDEANRHAADAPPVLTVADAAGTRTLIASLTAESITGYVEPSRLTDAMYRGITEEPLARDAYAKYHGGNVTECGFIVREDWGVTIGYSPDALVDDEGLLEIKSRNQARQLLTVLDGRVPTEHMAQVQTGLLVTGRKWLDFVSYGSGMALWIQRVYPDPLWFAAIRLAAARFQEVGSEMTKRYLELTEGLPVMERTPDPFDVELNLNLSGGEV